MHVEEKCHHLLQQWSDKPTQLHRLHHQVRGKYEEKQGDVAATQATPAASRQHQQRSLDCLKDSATY
jgi:hypothetical protein